MSLVISVPDIWAICPGGIYNNTSDTPCSKVDSPVSLYPLLVLFVSEVSPELKFADSSQVGSVTVQPVEALRCLLKGLILHPDWSFFFFSIDSVALATVHRNLYSKHLHHFI